jgi:hypothetical protein
MRAVRIAERDVNAGKLFVLEDVSDHVLQSDICSDGELAHPVAICVRMRVVPEGPLQFFILRVRFRQPVACDADRERPSLRPPNFAHK